jgi:hypothetical protein
MLLFQSFATFSIIFQSINPFSPLTLTMNTLRELGSPFLRFHASRSVRIIDDPAYPREVSPPLPPMLLTCGFEETGKKKKVGKNKNKKTVTNEDEEKINGYSK